MIFILPPSVFGCYYLFGVSKSKIFTLVQNTPDESMLLSEKKAAFEEYMRKSEEKLELRERNMLECTKQNSILILQEEYDKVMCSLNDKKLELENEKEKTMQEIENARKKAAVIMGEAEGHEREVFRRCGEIKTKVQEDCRLLRASAENECRATKLNEKKMAEDIKNKWQKLKIFTDEHYEKIKQMENETLLKIDEMANGHDFEYFFAQMLKSAGYDKVEVTKGSGDMGADIIAVKDGVRYAIQCKRYTNQVDTSAVQQVLSGLQYYHCHVGIVVTNSTYTQGAIELAAQTQVVLWSRHTLQKMVGEYCKNIYIKEF